MPVFHLVLMLLVPLASGFLLGLIQLACYRILRRPDDATPTFPVLFARGLLIFFIIAAILALVFRLLP